MFPRSARSAATPRTVEALDEPKIRPEKMHRLARPRVIFADYRLIAQDFPWLAGSTQTVPPTGTDSVSPGLQRMIDAWLLENAAIVSAGQASQSIVNTAIPVMTDMVDAYRPPRYGRAAVVPVRSGADVHGQFTESDVGLLDVKGVGIMPGRTPQPNNHANGLLDLDSLFVEVLKQWLLEAVLLHSKTAVSTLPIYAVLDAGFDVREYVTGHGLLRPAGIMVRRAHLR